MDKTQQQLRLFLAITFLLFGLYSASAQESPKIIQFTGVVFTPDSASVIPGVHVYVPKSGRGTTSNPYGFFSMPVIEGDSIVFSAVGFKPSTFVVPKHDSERSLRLLLTMKEDIQFLEEVEIFPYPTEAMFKKAVLTIELPEDENYENMQAWLAAEYMMRAYQNLPTSSNSNYRQVMEQQAMANSYKYQTPYNNFGNPFAWAKFIRQMRSDK